MILAWMIWVAIGLILLNNLVEGLAAAIRRLWKEYHI